MKESKELLIDAKCVAKLLDVSPRKIWMMRDTGQMPPPVRIGRSVKFRVADIYRWVQDGCPNCRPAPPGTRRVVR